MLVVAGLITEIVYLTAVLRLPIWRYGDKLVAWSDLLGGQQRPPGLLLVGLSTLVVAYIGGWYLLSEGPDLPGRRVVIWSGAIVFAVTLLGLMPFTADLFTYLSQAHSFTDLQINPLVEAPLSQGPDPLLASYGTVYLTQPTAYGPVWVLLSAVGTWGPLDIGWGLFYLKALCLFAFLGCARLLENLLQAVRPEKSNSSLYLFAWNPLVLLMAVGDAHNDIVMMLGVLLALWLLLQERWVPMFIVLTLSILTKYVSLIFVAPFAIYMWQVVPHRERLGTMIRATLAVLAVLLVLSVPLLMVESGGALSDLWFVRLLQRFLQPSSWRLGHREMVTGALVVGAGLFFASYVFLLGRFVVQRNRTPQTMFYRVIDLGFLLSLLAFVFGAARSQPWHLIWPASLTGLSSKRWSWPVIVALSVLMLAGQVWVEWGTPGLFLRY
jgi:hypothetical protein